MGEAQGKLEFDIGATGKLRGKYFKNAGSGTGRKQSRLLRLIRTMIRRHGPRNCD